jgi:hypothetical protein
MNPFLKRETIISGFTKKNKNKKIIIIIPYLLLILLEFLVVSFYLSKSYQL